MTKKGFESLYQRLLMTKEVLVYNFNIDGFVQYCKERGTEINGGAFALNAGIPYAQYFYI